MNKREIELHAGDAAILLHANGDIGLLIPKLDQVRGDEDAPEHVTLAMAFGVIARSPVLREMVQMMAESVADDASVGAMPEVAQ